MNSKMEFEYADCFTQLRYCGFSEEEIKELKAMKHPLSYLKTFVELAMGAQEMRNEDLEKELGVRN